MHLEVFTEEVSAETCLGTLLPRILGTEITFSIHPFQGKAALLRELPKRLRAFGRFLPDDAAVVVLVDADDPRTCRQLKAKLESWAHEAGLSTQSRRGSEKKFQVLNRIAVEELEAWYFGDVEALRAAYPRVPSTLGQRRGFRDPDAIRNTWETLERLLQKSGYHPQGLPKIAAARAISAHMEPARNVSRSFQAFRDGLRDLVGA